MTTDTFKETSHLIPASLDTTDVKTAELLLQRAGMLMLSCGVSRTELISDELSIIFDFRESVKGTFFVSRVEMAGDIRDLIGIWSPADPADMKPYDGKTSYVVRVRFDNANNTSVRYVTLMWHGGERAHRELITNVGFSRRNIF